MAPQPALRPARATPWHVTPAPVRAAFAVVGLTVLTAVIGLVFGLAAIRPTPHGLPIGVTGALGDRIQPDLDGVAPDGFTVTGYPDPAALRSAIRGREVYGGLITEPGATTVLIATGASPAAAQLLTRVGAAVAEHTGGPLRTEDLAALPVRDPYGHGLPLAALVLTVAGLLPALVLPMLFPGQIWLQVIATAAFALLGAVTMTLLLCHAFGSIEPSTTAPVAAVLALGLLAMSLPLVAVTALFGRIGLGIGVLVAVLVGAPLCGLAGAPELLSRGWGMLGQVLPQGATGTVLRSTGYFSGAGAGTALAVLTGWVVAGVLLIGIAGLRGRVSERGRVAGSPASSPPV